MFLQKQATVPKYNFALCLVLLLILSCRAFSRLSKVLCFKVPMVVQLSAVHDVLPGVCTTAPCVHVLFTDPPLSTRLKT